MSHRHRKPRPAFRHKRLLLERLERRELLAVDLSAMMPLCNTALVASPEQVQAAPAAIDSADASSSVTASSVTASTQPTVAPQYALPTTTVESDLLDSLTLNGPTTIPEQTPPHAPTQSLSPNLTAALDHVYSQIGVGY